MKMGTPYLLEIEGLSVSFDGFKAVDDLSVYVDNNEIRAISGPTERAKPPSSILISGRTAPSRVGSLSRPWTSPSSVSTRSCEPASVVNSKRRRSTESLTVFENLEMSYPDKRTWFSALALSTNARDRSARRRGRELIHLKDRLHERAEVLGHGQKQWLEIGALVMQEPKLLLLDEPVAGMSMHDRETTQSLLRRLSAGGPSWSWSTTWTSSNRLRTT